MEGKPMPLITLHTSSHVSDQQRNALLVSLSKTLSEGTGKPEKYVMVTINEQGAIMLAGKTGEAALIDIRGIGGFSREVNRNLTRSLCELLKDTLGLAPDRIYITFTDVPAQNWGWNGSTFG